MKVLVTGANGYLGQGIVKKLVELGVEVIAADYRCDHVDRRATIRECNIFEIDNPTDFFGCPDYLLHLAWKNGFDHNNVSHIADLPSHFKFLMSFIEKGIKRIGVMGTMHEIGFYEGPVSENTPCNPLSMYGIAKNALRQLVFSYSKNKNTVVQWFRAYYIVGNAEYGNSIFSKLLEASNKGQKLFPFTSGKHKYDFLDYDVFCEQVAYSVKQEEVNGIINICSGNPVSLSERVNKFIKDNNLGIELDYNKFPDRPYDSKAIWGDNRKINVIMKSGGDRHEKHK